MKGDERFCEKRNGRKKRQLLSQVEAEKKRKAEMKR
jgi:hypothetical protein